MKSLKDIIAEGVAVSSDFKLVNSVDVHGKPTTRKVRAHRKTINPVKETSEEKPDVLTSIQKFVGRQYAEEYIEEASTTVKQRTDTNRPTYDVHSKATGDRIGTIHTPSKTNPNHQTTVYDSTGKIMKRGEHSSLKDAHDFIKKSRNIKEDVELIDEEDSTSLKMHTAGYDVIHKKSGNKIGTVYQPTTNRSSHVAIVHGPKGSSERKEFKSSKEAHNHIKQAYGLKEEVVAEEGVGTHRPKETPGSWKPKGYERGTHWAQHTGTRKLKGFASAAERRAWLKTKPSDVAEEVELDEVSTDGYYKAAIKDRMKQVVKLMGGDKSANTKINARNAGMKRVEKRTRDEMAKANSGPQKPKESSPYVDDRGYGKGRYMGDSYELEGNSIFEASPKATKQSPNFGGVSKTEYDDGSSSTNYDAGPLSVQQKKDSKGNVESNRTRYDTGIDSVQVKSYSSGVKKLTVHGPGEDSLVGAEASAKRLGVDPKKLKSPVTEGQSAAVRMFKALQQAKKQREEEEAKKSANEKRALTPKQTNEAKDDEEDYSKHHKLDPDSGVEADQHIHVQLKKAIDSTMKPYEVTFKNGKKHTVSSPVAKTIVTAVEKLKPEHRKAAHDELHRSYDSLMAVHKAIIGK